MNALLTDELALTTSQLKLHPKVYGIWNHRRWCLTNVPDGPSDDNRDGWRQAYWNKELFVVEKMLDADARNCKPTCNLWVKNSTQERLVHAWNYRRYVLANMPMKRPAQAELTFTKRKIEANFSNFSAWHQRSKVLTCLWEAGQLDPRSSKEEGSSAPSRGLTHCLEPNEHLIRVRPCEECNVH